MPISYQTPIYHMIVSHLFTIRLYIHPSSMNTCLLLTPPRTLFSDSQV
jgi:hypothetical protein